MSDVTPKILESIRDELRAGFRATDARFETMEREFRAMLGMLGLMSARLFSPRGLEERVDHCERDIAEIKRRLDDERKPT